MTQDKTDRTGGGGVRALGDLVAYQAGAIVSKMILKKDRGSVTLFAFDTGQSLSEHTTPHDALVVVIDGESEIRIAGDGFTVRTGETLTLPANVPHAVRAVRPFKMMLVMIRD